jgi:hypothetical protein
MDGWEEFRQRFVRGGVKLKQPKDRGWRAVAAFSHLPKAGGIFGLHWHR